MKVVVPWHTRVGPLPRVIMTPSPCHTPVILMCPDPSNRTFSGCKVHGLTPWGHQAITPSHHQGITPSHHRGIRPSRHHAIRVSHHQGITPSGHHTIRASHHQAITPSHHRGIRPSHHHTIKASGHQAITLSHHHTIKASGHQGMRLGSTKCRRLANLPPPKSDPSTKPPKECASHDNARSRQQGIGIQAIMPSALQVIMP